MQKHNGTEKRAKGLHVGAHDKNGGVISTRIDMGIKEIGSIINTDGGVMEEEL